jgi:hypothetical protein
MPSAAVSALGRATLVMALFFLVPVTALLGLFAITSVIGSIAGLSGADLDGMPAPLLACYGLMSGGAVVLLIRAIRAAIDRLTDDSMDQKMDPTRLQGGTDAPGSE